MTEPAMRADGGAQDGAVARALGWLRAGYPEGVPQQDYVALLGVLRRSLTETELERIVRGLVEDAAANETVLNRAVIDARIAEVLKGPVLDADVVRVSARLAAAGWPLAVLGHDTSAVQDSPPTRANLIARVVEWLRGGYPSGLPDTDYIPLLALLRRRLTDTEITEVSSQLIRDGVFAPGRVDIGTAILQVTAELPAPDDVERVRRYLTEHGWPPDLSI